MWEGHPTTRGVTPRKLVAGVGPIFLQGSSCESEEVTKPRIEGGVTAPGPHAWAWLPFGEQSEER